MRNTIAILLLVTCAPLLAAEKAASPQASSSKPKALLGIVSLDVFAETPARLHLLIGERIEAGQPPRLAYVRSENGGESWSEPAVVGGAAATPDPIKRGNDAQIVAAGDQLLAVWTTGAATKMGRGPLAALRSADGGKTWTAAPSPSDAKGVIDHAFIDLAADEAGTFHAVWLDARPTAAMLVNPDMPGKSLRYARTSDGGATWSKSQSLDSQCCECCWNDLLIVPGGHVNVLYRDKDPRDMAMISSANSGTSWDKPVTVGAFEWNFTGCPHVGGALAAGGPELQHISAVVWTAKGGSKLGVYALSSADAGKTWNTPTQLGGPQASRPDLAASGNRVVAVWDEYLENPDASGNAAFNAVSTDNGQSWSPPKQVSDPAVSVSHPRIVATPNGFRAFWTEQSRGKPVRWTSKAIE